MLDLSNVLSAVALALRKMKISLSVLIVAWASTKKIGISELNNATMSG